MMEGKVNDREGNVGHAADAPAKHTGKKKDKVKHLNIRRGRRNTKPRENKKASKQAGRHISLHHGNTSPNRQGNCAAPSPCRCGVRRGVQRQP